MNLPWRYILVSLAIGLLLGAAGGLLSARYVFKPGRWMNPERLVRHLDRDLKLNENQRGQIRDILVKHRQKIRTHRQQAHKDLHQDIRQVLTPEQQTAFDQREAEQAAQRKDR